jgi:hypothetical protein
VRDIRGRLHVTQKREGCFSAAARKANARPVLATRELALTAGD